MSALIHAETADSTIALAARAALTTMDPRRAELLFDALWGRWSVDTRAALEKPMPFPSELFTSDFARRYIAQGRVESSARLLLRFIARRGLQLTDEQRAAILDCREPEQLDAW